jgi:CBS-domain-containing membrane protein
MLSDFHPLPHHALDAGAGLVRSDTGGGRPTRLNDPAMEVMTDLRSTLQVTIGPEALLRIAHERMMHRGVRLLFVVDDNTTLLGLITATDVLGEKPMQHIQRTGGTREDIRVRDIMTPHNQLEVLTLADVLGAKVGHVVATLMACGRQHALVVDREEASGWQMVRGIFSASQIARQTGMEIQITHKAETFAEIEAGLAK